MFIYAGIGSRTTPDHILSVMTKISYQLAKNWKLRSGHADGADSAFEEGCVQWATEHKTEPNMEIFLPWPGFNGATASKYHIVPKSSEELIRVASIFHPAWDRCSPATKFLHMRNVCQIAGRNLNTAADMMICWTPRGKREGGTGQALRIAEYLNIPIFDLAVDGAAIALSKFVDQKEKQLIHIAS